MVNIVTIGGGSGRFTLLQGLKKYDFEITALVPTTDSGGSSGRLRDEYGILPPGDLTRTIVALSQSTGLLTKVCEYRFDNGKDGKGSLNGHKLGNLIYMALKDITNDPEEAILQLSNILKIKGKVVPTTIDNVHLVAELENGQQIFGETNIDVPKHDGNLKIKKLSLNSTAATASKSALNAIREADVILLGPGDLYTSTIANLLVGGIPEAISQSRAKKVFVCNLMTKFGETSNFKASDHLNEVEKYLGSKIDAIIANSKLPSSGLAGKYKDENSIPVRLDYENLQETKIIAENIINEKGGLIRHDSTKIAEIISKLAELK